MWDSANSQADSVTNSTTNRGTEWQATSMRLLAPTRDKHFPENTSKFDPKGRWWELPWTSDRSVSSACDRNRYWAIHWKPGRHLTPTALPFARLSSIHPMKLSRAASQPLYYLFTSNTPFKLHKDYKAQHIPFWNFRWYVFLQSFWKVPTVFWSFLLLLTICIQKPVKMRLHYSRHLINTQHKPGRDQSLN